MTDREPAAPPHGLDERAPAAFAAAERQRRQAGRLARRRPVGAAAAGGLHVRLRVLERGATPCALRRAQVRDVNAVRWVKVPYVVR